MLYIYIERERVLEYGVRGTGSGFLRKSMGQMGDNGFPRKPTGSLFCSHRSFRKPLRAYGRM